MTTKQMEYILELSKTLNFNKAAENLFTSQPTLTYQIKAAEDEIGFRIFDRSGKGASLTPAGSQFCVTLRTIHEELKKAIEQGQNFSASYQDDISICLPVRSAIYFLPAAIKRLSNHFPSTSVTPGFSLNQGIELFQQNNYDILFGCCNDMKKAADVKIHPLFESHIYLITKKSDPLAKKDLIKLEDLSGQTLMIGGGSPLPLRRLQQQIISSIDVAYFNSPDHDTTLINVASDKGICLAPGFLNDHNKEFAWTPFETDVTIPCQLYTHTVDQRENLAFLVRAIQDTYKEHPDFEV